MDADGVHVGQDDMAALDARGFETTPEFLAQQLDAVFTDIYPDAIKIGMVSSSALIETIAKKLRQYDAKHIVVDPVMVATSGSKLLQDSAIQILTGQLLPMAEVVTPNIPEAEILSGMTITDAAGMEAAAKCISEKYGCAVLCKGGHKVNDADDLLWRNGSGSGVIFYSQNAWDGWGAWGYSLAFNLSSRLPEGILSILIVSVLPLTLMRRAIARREANDGYC